MSMFDNWMGDKKAAPATPNGAGNPAPVTNGNGTNHNPNLQNEDKNNQRTNPDLIATIWDEQKTTPTAGDPTGSSNPLGNPAVPATPAQKTEEQMRGEVSAHLNQVGLGEFTITPEIAAKIQEGDFTALTSSVNTRIQQSYLQAMRSSQQLFTSMLEAQLPKAVEEAVNKSKSFFEGDRLRSIMHKELPFTEDPSIGPVAETVMRQFLTKGASKDKAIQLTKDYFTRMRQAMDPDYIPSNTNTKTTFRGNPRQAGEMGWLDVLKGN